MLPFSNTITSKSTEPSFFVIFTDIWLVVPPHCGTEMCWCPHRTLSAIGRPLMITKLLSIQEHLLKIA